MAKPIGRTFVEIDVDAKKYNKGIVDVKTTTKKKLTEIEKAWKGLGKKSEKTYDDMRAAVNKNYDKIKKHASSTADDIYRAEKAKNEKIARINKQQFGEQKSWIDKIKKHWIALSVVAVAAIMAIRKAGRVIIATVKEWVNLAAKQELAEINLAAALKASGVYTDALNASYQAFATSIQAVTKYGDEEVLTLMALMKNLGVTTDRLEEATKMAIGLATATGRDVQSMAMYIALAEQGEFTMLRRYIPALRATTDATEQMKIITDFAARGFKVAQTQTASFAIGLTQLRNLWGDLKEKLGDFIIKNKLVLDLMQKTKDWLIKVGDKVEAWRKANQTIIDQKVENVFNKLAEAGEWFISLPLKEVLDAIVNVFEYWLPILRETVGYWADFFKIADENRAPFVSTADDIKEGIKALNQQTAGFVKTQTEINELIDKGIVPASAYATMLAKLAEKIEWNKSLVSKYENALKGLIKVKMDETKVTEDNTKAWDKSTAASLKEEKAARKSIETHDELFSLIFVGLDRAAKKWEDFSDEAIAAALKTEKESGGNFNNLYGMMFVGMDQVAREWEDSMEDIEKAAETASKGMMERFKNSARNIASSVKDTLGTVWSVVSNIWGKIKSMAGMFTGAITFFITFPGDLKEAMERFTDSIADFPKIVDEFLAAVGTFVDNLPKIIITFIKSAGKFIDGLVKAIPKVITAIIKELPKLVDSIIKGAEQFTAAILKKLPDIVAALIKQVPKLITSIMEKFIPALLDAVPKVLEKLLEGIPAIIKALIAGIPKVITALMKAIAALIPVLLQAIPKIVRSLITNIATNVPKIIKAFLDGIPDIIIALVKGVPEFIKAIVQDIPILVRALIDSIPEIIAAFIDSVPAIAEALVESIKSLIPSKGRDIYDPFDIFHSGGVVGQTQTASRSVAPAVFASAPRAHSGLMAGEVPIIAKRGEGIFTPAQMRALGRQGGGSDRPIHIHVDLDGREVGLAIVKDGDVIEQMDYQLTKRSKRVYA